MDIDSLTKMDARKTLAANVQRLADEWADTHNHGKRSLLAWAKAYKIDYKTAQRAISGKHSTQFDQLQHLADQLDLSPWQLLHPIPGAVRLSPRARSIAAMFDDLPTEEQRARAYALIVQILEFGNTGNPPASGSPIPEPAPRPRTPPGSSQNAPHAMHSGGTGRDAEAEPQRQ